MGPFDEEEVETVIKKCGTNKAPGPDGYNIEFYRDCWGFMKADVMAAVNEFYIKGKLDIEFRLMESACILFPNH